MLLQVFVIGISSEHRSKAGTLSARSQDKQSMQGGHSTMSLDRASIRKYGGKMKSYNNELETYVICFIFYA